MRFKGYSSDLAALIATEIATQLDRQSRVLWLCSGGSNTLLQVKIMDHLVGSGVSLEGLTILAMDERFGGSGHPDSNFQQLKQAGFKVGQATWIDVLAKNLDFDQTVQNYSNLLKDLNKKSDFTIATFGIGADGHTAGILPGSAAVDAQQPVYGYVWQDYVRITITPNWLVGVDKAFVVARGQAKLDALSRLKAAASSTAELPSMLLNKIKDVVVYTDIKELL